MPEARIARLERLRGQPPERRTLLFFIRAVGRKGRWHWFPPDLVPPFEGDTGWFELERIKGGWRVVRQVDPPPWAR